MERYIGKILPVNHYSTRTIYHTLEGSVMPPQAKKLTITSNEMLDILACI